MVEGLDFNDSEDKGRPSGRYDGSEAEASNYRGAFPVENKGHVEKVAEFHEGIRVVTADGIAHVYGNRIPASQYADDIGVELTSYEEAEEAEPVDTASAQDMEQLFGDFISSTEEDLESKGSGRAKTDGGRAPGDIGGYMENFDHSSGVDVQGSFERGEGYEDQKMTDGGVSEETDFEKYGIVP